MIPLFIEDPLEPPQGPLEVPGPHFGIHYFKTNKQQPLVPSNMTAVFEVY